MGNALRRIPAASAFARRLAAGMTIAVTLLGLAGHGLAGEGPARWTIGKPIVTYWAGPRLTDAVAEQLAEGGWNVVWASEEDLDVAARHGLRAQLQHALLRPESLDDPQRRTQLDALVDRVKNHPALYSYFLRDEPSAKDFPGLGRLVAYLRERDPAHLAYINLFPTYANNAQLGTEGDVVTAYREHLRLYMEIVKPDLVSYDHYQFRANGDGDQYFLNLAMIRETALRAGVPFLNIVQACSWTPSMRVPNGDELRYLVYTSLAYGAEGISYYVYCWPNHVGGMAEPDGTPTPLYHAARVLNRHFEAIAAELQPLQSSAVYHAGKVPWGGVALPDDSPVQVKPAGANQGAAKDGEGWLLGLFGPAGSEPTDVVVVNLDYRAARTAEVRGSGAWEKFDPDARTWTEAGRDAVRLDFPPGGGILLRRK
ncbi:MAG: hypothetical protein GYA33_08265 [Thermogutta sp.]|nr:hypothetical protein [Thermogutta sp.]